MNDQKADSNNLPDTVAFQHEFTREFMESPEEVKDGYYRFKSKTDGYTMLYPTNAEMDDRYYEIKKDLIEFIFYGGKKKENISFSVKAKYENSKLADIIWLNLETLSESIGYEGEYQKLEYKDKTIYFAKDIYQFEEKEYSPFYSFFAYIISKKSNQGIEFKYEVTCTNDKKSCQIDTNKEEEIAKMLMKSIQFNPKASGEKKE
ncbi:hypothetical protein [Bacillus sp. FJAT-47783]|uniref:hypothetical protein n=1 Tax=Bacillus sp. FJAT-47783 TaxID=2922712 RepID=UPI001FAC639E|nr:hypothetical protein [Bacillus sp. FJAT-47783]